MTATIIAEALAAAERETPEEVPTPGYFSRVSELNDTFEEYWCSGRAIDVLDPALPGRCRYLRADVVEAALKRLEERAARAEAEVRSLRAVVRQAHLDLETGSEASCTVSLHLYRALDDAAKEAKP